jgi:hypothetical protein
LGLDTAKIRYNSESSTTGVIKTLKKLADIEKTV